ncbi:MAG TPA: hypothetical protein PLU30_19735 [Verrucomicrobiae bacterium]|nr:hypothetical protein [Verrucomicrobiae bacterium]
MTAEETKGKYGPRSLIWATAAMAAVVVVVAGMLSSTPNVGSEQDRAKEEKNLENMQQLVRACLLYADDNGGVLPDSLGQLVAETKLNPEILYSPFVKDRSQPSYELALRGRIFGSETDLDPEILYAPAAGGDGDGTDAAIARTGNDRYEVPSNVILIIEREGLRPGARRFVLLNGLPGSLDLKVDAPR